MRLFAHIALLLLVGSAQAQVRTSYYDFARPDLDWYTIETEHFRVHFHADTSGTGSSRTAQVVARIAEEVWDPITELYELELDTPVSFILKDYEDYSNGAAYFFDNMIEIWAPALDTPFRGEHAWLRNVITHEFTHLVQVQKTMKANRGLPFFYLQYLDYEEVRRPDVLYGYPNVIATYPIPVLNNPAWLAEGTAQYQRASLDYDRWDSHRDMLLRTRILAGQELSLQDMGGFYSHTSLGRESVYNHGFAFTQYIASTRGEDALRGISNALADWPNFTFEAATSDALGIGGQELYDEWVAHLRTEYAERIAGLKGAQIAGEVVTDEGFLNFYPRVSPDGTKLAWLTNRGEDFSRKAIHVMDLSAESGLTGGAAALREGSGRVAPEVLELDAGATEAGYTCSFGHRLVSGSSSSFDWHPDGSRILYSRVEDRSDGHLVSDLWEVDVATRQRERVTDGRRASAPAYSPDGALIAFVTQEDGTSNLALLDRTAEEDRPLTDFRAGEQVTEPRFSGDGTWVYFAVSERRGRDLWRAKADGSLVEPVLRTPHDERSPAPQGDYLYYASDAEGIYNLYRMKPGSAEPQPERLTTVTGGAFMPEPAGDGSVYFARYEAEGYRIARIASPTGLAEIDRYEPPPVMGKRARPAPGIASPFNAFDDTGVRAFDAATLAAARDSSAAAFDVPYTSGSADPSRLGTYTSTFTSFSFLPVIRLDRYVSRRRTRTDVRLPDRGVAETLIRNTKVGVYSGSREVLPGLAMFGGLLVSPTSGPAESLFDFASPSNLLKLERDLFLQFEYLRGMGLFPKRWSPQFSIELFNVRRNVDNGLSIEEFPCTACFPDTTLADISYNLWEVDFAARAKVTRSLLLEIGVRYSPYRVTTERFFSKELNQSIPESSSRYFVGRAARFKAYFEALQPHRHDDVVMEGLRVEAMFEREGGQLLDRFDVEEGILKPVYERDTINRLTIDARAGMRVVAGPLRAPHGVELRTRLSTVLGGTYDDFYDDYVGGLTGARGYPFYALGGNKTLWVQAAYTLPLVPDLRRQLLFLYVDKLYARVYADAAAAWTGAWPGFGAIRKDVGAELRLGLGSFYLLPAAFFVSATYGLDSFVFRLDEGFLTPDGSSSVRYGRAFQWHVGLLFGFDQL